MTVPDSYYVGAYHSPTSHKDVDRNWVNSQNPQGYTIEVAEGERPAQVAGKLYKLPKNDRRAQIKYNKNGKTYYKGVYGSYNNYEDAQKALNNLPIFDLEREEWLKNYHANLCVENNLPYTLVAQLFDVIIEFSRKKQNNKL